ncbi:MAG TPA: multidrug efflux RND transporter permease subunit [Chthoniobacteraceae bacterium]|nr:multidrug efflux RND transporter permease subunit [Chthoniobacteraceae bacterium]
MTEFFIRRPIAAIVISVFILILGGIAMLLLPVAQFPDITPPQVQVTGRYTGADALTVEKSVAAPIEQQMSGVDGMEAMYSINGNDGSMTLRANFELGTDPNTDQILVQMREAQAGTQLPNEVNELGVTVQKSFSAPLLLISLYSPDGSRDAEFLANYAYINLNDELSRVKGIGQVKIFGAGQYAMRIWVDPQRLAAVNLTIPDVLQAVKDQSRPNPIGILGGEPAPEGQKFTYTARARGMLSTAEEFGDIILRQTPEGATVRMRDVGRVELGAQSYNLEGRLDGKPSAILALYQLPGSNAVNTADAAKALMEQLKTRFPTGVDYLVSLDTTLPVVDGIHEIVETLLIAVVLVILVVYLFLQSWRATFIPLLAVPVSLIGTFAVFPLLGFSINTLSLFGLVLAIGLVVDDAIVVVEAVEHHIAKGLSPVEATRLACREIRGPVIGIALVLASVFVPTAFIPGLTGRLYQQFAVTIAVSVIISAFSALTLSPALCALLLKPRSTAKGWISRFFDRFNRSFERWTDRFVSVSDTLVRRIVLMLLLLGIFSGAALWFNQRLPSSFLPDEDQGFFFINLQLPNAASLQRTGEAARKVEEILARTPGIDRVTTIVGYSMLSNIQTTYSGFFFVTLKPLSERKGAALSYPAIRGKLNKELIVKLPDCMAFAFAPPAIPGVGTAGGATFVLQDRQGHDVSYLSKNVDTFLAAAAKRPELGQVRSTFLGEVPQIFVNVDRDKALKQGVSLQALYATLQTYMGGSFVNYFNRFGRQWPVYVQAEGDARSQTEQLGDFYVRNDRGEPVPLSTLARFENRSGPEFTMRYNLYRSAQINAGAAPGYSSAQAMKALEEVFAETMPSGMGYGYLGMSFEEKKAQEAIPPSVIFGFSLLFVFLILAALYENWSLPFSVLLSTPVAVFGALGLLYLRRFAQEHLYPPILVSIENNVFAQIGLIMVIGLSAKNAILIVEFAKAEYERGQSLAQAALTAARLRFRPVLMTSVAFILGCLPLCIAGGAGAISRQVMGTTVVGGMMAATLFGLMLVPAIFCLVGKLSGAEKPPEPVVPPAADLPLETTQSNG